ncbi:Maltose O-acetyltransferase [Geobacillus stearothermophilus]|nr:Maltose O-acetyltransferase [Geobacillus stearothermophilus]
MKSEKEKMVAGHLYSPADLELVKERERARRLVRLYNETANAVVAGNPGKVIKWIN